MITIIAGSRYLINKTRDDYIKLNKQLKHTNILAPNYNEILHKTREAQIVYEDFNYNLVVEAVRKSGFEITKIISGGAHGIDKAGEKYARVNNIPYEIFVPDWIKFGKGGGAIRNMEMSKIAEALIAIWDEKSSGTRDMIWRMNVMKKKVYVERIKS